MPTFDLVAPTHPVGRQAPLTIDNTSGGVALAGPGTNNSWQGVVYAELAVEGAQIRFTIDGTAPTISVGRIANPGDTLKLALNDFSKFRAIRTGSTNATIQGDYYGGV